MIDVSDLYDAFHAIAASIWRDFGSTVDDESWDDIIDSLEHDLFLAACAHRLAATEAATEAPTEAPTEGHARPVEIDPDQMLDPDEIPGRIRLYATNGNEIPGAAGQYHSHAFYPDPESGAVPNAVMTGDLMSRDRSEMTLVLTGRAQKHQQRRGQLPQVR